MSTDGAQDEAPRFPKTLATAIHLFRLLELDVLLHGINAAGLSAFNPVERRMAILILFGWQNTANNLVIAYKL